MRKSPMLIVVLGLVLVAGVWLFWRKQTNGSDFPTIRSSDEFETLDVVAHLDVPVSNNQSIMYCGSFQLAWNELGRVLGGKVMLDGQLAASLNNQVFSKDDVDPGAVVIESGFDEKTIARINKQMEELGVKAPPTQGGGQQQLSVMAVLRKSLKFRHKFEKLSRRVMFDNGSDATNVQAFGISKAPEPLEHSDVSRQVELKDYRSRHDFVVHLRCDSDDDVLILAKIPVSPGPVTPKLKDMVDEVLRRSRTGRGQPPGRLSVPLLRLNVAHRFQELIGRPIGNDKWSGWFITDAIQATRFELNEAGAELLSAAKMDAKKDGPKGGPPPRRNLIFDRPFLLIMKQQSSSRPYFVMWVASLELLVR